MFCPCLVSTVLPLQQLNSRRDTMSEIPKFSLTYSLPRTEPLHRCVCGGYVLRWGAFDWRVRGVPHRAELLEAEEEALWCSRGRSAGPSRSSPQSSMSTSLRERGTESPAAAAAPPRRRPSPCAFRDSLRARRTEATVGLEREREGKREKERQRDRERQN